MVRDIQPMRKALNTDRSSGRKNGRSFSIDILVGVVLAAAIVSWQKEKQSELHTTMVTQQST